MYSIENISVLKASPTTYVASWDYGEHHYHFIFKNTQTMTCDGPLYRRDRNEQFDHVRKLKPSAYTHAALIDRARFMIFARGLIEQADAEPSAVERIWSGSRRHAD